MEKTNFDILLFVVFLTSLCNSNDYNYDDYKYNEYNYDEDEYYGYNDQKPEDYTDDYSQDLNDYYDQNLLAPPNPPPPPPTPHPIPPPPPRPMGKMTLFSSLDVMKYRFIYFSITVYSEIIYFHVMSTSENQDESKIYQIHFKMFSFLLVMRYMVATGYSYTTKYPPGRTGIDTVEIVDVSNPTKSCELDDDIIARHSSTGGMLGTTPVICGGWQFYGGGPYVNTCLLYGTSQKIMMNSYRQKHSSVLSYVYYLHI